MIFTARFGAAQAALGYAFYNSSGVIIGSRTTSGIVSLPETGSYMVDVAIPSGAVVIYWNDTTTLATALEDLTVLNEVLAIDVGGGGAGSGAYTITVTVTDGTDPLENAIVRLIEGVSSYTATTDASGEAVFALDAATYSVAVTKAGYQFTPTTRTVTGNEAGTLTNDLEMELRTAPPAPGDPDLCAVYVDTQTIIGEAIEDAEIVFSLLKGVRVSTGGRVVSQASETVTTDVNGRASIELEKGLRYHAVNTSLFGTNGVKFTVPDEDTLDLATIVQIL